MFTREERERETFGTLALPAGGVFFILAFFPFSITRAHFPCTEGRRAIAKAGLN